jgi:hypothetical protein
VFFSSLWRAGNSGRKGITDLAAPQTFSKACFLFLFHICIVVVYIIATVDVGSRTLKKKGLRGWQSLFVVVGEVRRGVSRFMNMATFNGRADFLLFFSEEEGGPFLSKHLCPKKDENDFHS